MQKKNGVANFISEITLACFRLSVVGGERKQAGEKNEGGLTLFWYSRSCYTL